MSSPAIDRSLLTRTSFPNFPACNDQMRVAKLASYYLQLLSPISHSSLTLSFFLLVNRSASF